MNAKKSSSKISNNNSNIGRETPSPIKRILRQEAGYGCCKCGHPILQYHHIIPFSDDKHFRPEDMMVLCPNHHDEATNNVITISAQRKLKSHPYNIKQKKANGLLVVEQHGCDINLGGFIFSSGEGSLVSIDSKELIGTYENEQGSLLLNIKLYDESNKLIAELNENEWVVNEDFPWDLSYHYRKLIIRNAPRNIAISIDCNSIPILITGKIWGNRKLLKIDTKGIHVNNANMIGTGRIIGGVLQLSTKQEGFKIIPNQHPQKGMFFMLEQKNN